MGVLRGQRQMVPCVALDGMAGAGDFSDKRAPESRHSADDEKGRWHTLPSEDAKDFLGVVRMRSIVER